MAPRGVDLVAPLLTKRLPRPKEVNRHQRSNETLDEVILEAWSQGFLVGGLIVLIMITIANMRRGVLLHKLILIELVMALGHGTFIFSADPIYGWHLSCTAIFLYLSWYLHNIVAWMKNRPFLPRWGSRLYIGTVVLVFPYWICEMFYNFNYFNALGNDGFTRTRPWEALARDPWWIFTTCSLIYIIKREYKFGLFELIRASPRFGVLIMSMFLSIVFLITDVVVTAAHIGGPSGINPYWKLALVFKCAADALFLDDFKKVLDVLITHTFGKNAAPNAAIAAAGAGAGAGAGAAPAAVAGPQMQQRGVSIDARTDSEAVEVEVMHKPEFDLQPIHPIVTSESYGTIVPAARAHSFDGSEDDDDIRGSHRHANIFNMPGFNRRRRSSDESFGNWDDFPADMTPVYSTHDVPVSGLAPAPISIPKPLAGPFPEGGWQQAYHQKQGLAPFRSPTGPPGPHTALEWYDVTHGPRSTGNSSPSRPEPRSLHSRSRSESNRMIVPEGREPPPVPSRSPARSIRTPDGSTHSGRGGWNPPPPPRSVGTPDGSTHSGIGGGVPPLPRSVPTPDGSTHSGAGGVVSHIPRSVQTPDGSTHSGNEVWMEARAVTTPDGSAHIGPPPEDKTGNVV